MVEGPRLQRFLRIIVRLLVDDSDSRSDQSLVYYKVEAYTASERAAKYLYDSGIVPVLVSDNPVTNSQHVVWEAAKAYSNGLPYHIALAGVTSAPAELLGFGERVGKVKEGFDADIVVWDSDPLSVGAAPLQVWIDGAPQFKNPVELKKPEPVPIKPDPKLQEEMVKAELANVVFTNITHNWVDETTMTDAMSVIVTDGIITCLGPCHSDIVTAESKGFPVISLQNGYFTPSFTAFGSSLGLLEIDAERDTQDGGYNDDSFARAIDGLALDTKQLSAAFDHGVSRAISAPSRGSINAKGVSVGFLTGSKNTLEEKVIFEEDVAVHYPLTSSAKSPSISSAVGNLRRKLLEALKPETKEEKKKADPYSEQSYLRQVVAGKLTLVLSVHKADTIAAIIRMKQSVEEKIKETKEESSLSKPKSQIRIIILGGAESHLIASDIAAAGIAVILAPLLPYSQTWDERRSLTGAPLTNGTAINKLLDAGVLTGIGVNEIYETRSLSWMAGWAWRNSEGRLTEKEAFALAGANIYKMLGLDMSLSQSDWVLSDGNPLEIGRRIRAIGSGGRVSVWR
jgi:imidazolonepropionase-like amidohydrolase